MVIAEIESLEQSGRPGAAEYFRKCAATFLNWLVDRGAIAASPMAGYRRPKETRAQKLAQRRWVMTTPDEIRHAAMVSVTTVGFPTMMAGLRWVEDALEQYLRE